MKIAVVLLAMLSFGAIAEEMCRVKVCNKIERFSLSIWSHMKDGMGESCFETVLPKSESVVDKELSSESRWYQGSGAINPTKRSVTRVKEVHSCE